MTIKRDDLILEQLPIAIPDTVDVQFIMGGLRAAQNSKPKIRHKILKDVAEVLNTSPESLEFLFVESCNDNSDAEIYDFPDSSRRRQIIRHNLLDAAE